jgi:hypothetical protein
MSISRLDTEFKWSRAEEKRYTHCIESEQKSYVVILYRAGCHIGLKWVSFLKLITNRQLWFDHRLNEYIC